MKLTILKEKKFLYLAAVGKIFYFISLVLLVFNFSKFSYPTIIHFNYLNGVDFLGDANDLLVVFLTVFFLIFVNIVLAYHLFLRDKLSSYIFLSFNILIAFLLFVFVLVVIYNN